jgi:hypothetical protein
MIDLSLFANPPSIYRTAPFWALNHKLEDGELIRQIRAFREQGMGGAFLHPRGGMDTVYFSEEYFHAIETCIKELHTQGMIAWLYDEDRYPSGFAGGLVTGGRPEYAQQIISEDGEVTIPVGWSGHNGEPYVDVCNPEATQRFIELTHEEYYRRFAEYFGNTIPAIFTDEPNFSTQSGLPWTTGFEDKFLHKYGYDIRAKLEDLFNNTPEGSLTRLHYWELISSLFVSGFCKPIHDWCAEKGIAYTGHFWEHVFPSPGHQGSVMPHYAYMHYPGIDMLFVSSPNNPEQYGNAPSPTNWARSAC